MKKILVLIFIAGHLISCHNYKADTEKLNAAIDSMKVEADMKDSSIVGFLNDFNEIQANLDSIKKMEDLVTVQSAQGREMDAQQKKLILDDIALINDLLQKNKDLTSSLQKRLNSANARVGQLQGVVAEFEKMVQSLEGQIERKDAEILALNEQVEKLNFDINSLNQKISVIEDESQHKTEVIESQTLQLNEAYYTYGSVKELKDNEIINRTGGLLGIGRTSEVREDFNQNYFTKVDIREFDFVPLMVKKAEVVSVHPADSYHISGENSADTLYIDKKEDFWSASKYLVIEIK